MYIGLTFTLIDNTELYVYDDSSLDSPYPVSLDTVSLTITSNHSTTPYTFNCVDYLLDGYSTGDTAITPDSGYRGSQSIGEILKLIPSQLGFSTEYFPDGVYTFKYTINQYEEITKKIFIFETIRLAVAELNSQLNYGVTVGENSWELPGDYADSDLETVRLANALLDSILTYAREVEIPEDTETQILELLTKLTNLLQLT